MAKYISISSSSKLEWLDAHATPIDKEVTVALNHCKLACIDNGAFLAIAVIQSEEDYNYINDPSDGRKVSWFVACKHLVDAILNGEL